MALSSLRNNKSVLRGIIRHCRLRPAAAVFQVAGFAAATVLFLSMPARAFFSGNLPARAQGLGGAFVGAAQPESLFVNPAATVFLREDENKWMFFDFSMIAAGLAQSAENLQEWNTGVVFGAGKDASAGISADRFALTGHYSETTIKASYARKILQKVSASVTAKQFIKEYIEDDYTRIDPVFRDGLSKSAFSADVGAMYKSEYYGFGLSAENVIPADLGFQSQSMAPLTVTLGFHYLPVWRDTMITLDASYRERYSEISAGFEKWLLLRRFGIRGGFTAGDYKTMNITAGFSVNLNQIRLSYAILWPTSGLINTYGTHKLSVAGRF